MKDTEIYRIDQVHWVDWKIKYPYLRKNLVFPVWAD